MHWVHVSSHLSKKESAEQSFSEKEPAMVTRESASYVSEVTGGVTYPVTVPECLGNCWCWG